MNRNPYNIIKSRHITEKSSVLEGLHAAEGSKSLTRCKKPKFVFVVDIKANKAEIAHAVETIYKEKGVKVSQVNTVTIKPKKRRVRGRVGYKSGFKKAIVTCEVGDMIESEV